MSANMEVITTPAPQYPSLMAKVAARFSVDPKKMMDTLKQTAFKQKDHPVTDEQMMALMIVADQYGLNPFTKELYAYPDKNNGIVPVVSIDGWANIINTNPQMDGLEFAYSDDIVNMAGAKPCPVWVDAIIYRKDRMHPIRVREFLDETFRASQYPGPWQTHTKRMLRHKATIQCARLAFGFAGIYDEDEASRIVESQPSMRASETARPMGVSGLRARTMDVGVAAETINPDTGGITPTAEAGKAPIRELPAVSVATLIKRLNTCKDLDAAGVIMTDPDVDALNADDAHTLMEAYRAKWGEA